MLCEESDVCSSRRCESITFWKLEMVELVNSFDFFQETKMCFFVYKYIYVCDNLLVILYEFY